MVIPLLEAIAIEGKDITADALLTQRRASKSTSSDAILRGFPQSFFPVPANAYCPRQGK